MCPGQAGSAGREADVIEALRRINRAWTGGRFDELETLLHPDIVLRPPGFVERERGREGFVAGHRAFHEYAVIHEFHEQDLRVDVVGDTAVATCRYELVYETSGQRRRSRGRDLWVFALGGGAWAAVWRTVLDPEEEPVEMPAE